MKTRLLLPVIAIACITFVSWKYLTGYTPQSIRERILLNFFEPVNRYRDAAEYADTTVHLPVKGKYSGRVEENYIYKQVNVSPSIMYYTVYTSLDTNAYFNYSSCTYNEKFRADFRKLFGQEIVKEEIKMLTLDDDGKPNVFRLYNGAAITAAFTKLYVKPTDKFKGWTMQRMYDLTLKEYVRNSAEVVGAVMEKKGLLEELSKEYMQKAKTDSLFDGKMFVYDVTPKFVTKSYEGTALGKFKETRIVSIMLRRQCDGSLPALIGCLKMMIKDYDPEYYKEIRF